MLRLRVEGDFSVGLCAGESIMGFLALTGERANSLASFYLARSAALRGAAAQSPQPRLWFARLCWRIGIFP